jgi:hypothetical protein
MGWGPVMMLSDYPKNTLSIGKCCVQTYTSVAVQLDRLGRHVTNVVEIWK